MDTATVGIQPVTTTCKFCEEEFTYTPVQKRITFTGRKSHKGKALSKRAVCDKCKADRNRPERIKKFGLQAKDWPSNPTERLFHQERINTAYYIHASLAFVPPKPHPMSDSGIGRYEQGWPMADNECEHGRLPGDPCPSPVVTYKSKPGEKFQSWPHDHPCGCFPQEG